MGREVQPRGAGSGVVSAINVVIEGLRFHRWRGYSTVVSIGRILTVLTRNQVLMWLDGAGSVRFKVAYTPHDRAAGTTLR